MSATFTVSRRPRRRRWRDDYREGEPGNSRTRCARTRALSFDMRIGCAANRGRAEDVVQGARNEHLRAFERKSLDMDDREVEELDLPMDCQMDVAVDVRRALAAIPASLREPLMMQVLGGFSCAEIAAALETTEGAIMTRLTRARQTLAPNHRRRNFAERGCPMNCPEFRREVLVIDQEVYAILSAKPSDLTCPFQGTIAHHVVIATPEGKATPLLLPQMAVSEKTRASARGLRAVVAPAGGGSVAIIAGGSGLERLEQFVVRS